MGIPKLLASLILYFDNNRIMAFWQPAVYDLIMRSFKHPNVNEFSLGRVLYALSDPLRLEIVRRLACVDAASRGELDGGLVHTQNFGIIHMNTLRKDDLDCRFPGLLEAILAQRE